MKKRILKTLSAFLCILSLIVSMSAFAFADTDINPDGDEQGGEIVDEPVKTVKSYKENFSDIIKFLDVGKLPDLTAGSVDFEFEDDSTENYTLTQELLPTDFSTAAPGLAYLEFEIYETPFEIRFLVFDKNADISRFKDVSRTYWGYPHILRGVSAGFFAGRSQTEFGSLAELTRAEFCQMLYNIYNKDTIMKPSVEIKFTDVKQGEWYYKAVTACAEAGIVAGVGGGRFDPNGSITRQDAAIMMMKIILGPEKLKTVNVENTLALARANGIAAKDFDSTADYAKRAMAASLGVIYFGDDKGNVTPLNVINRSECAAVMSNYFFADYVEQKEAPLIYLSPSNQMSNAYAGIDTTEGKEMQAVAKVTQEVLLSLGYRVYTADVNTPIKDTNEYGKEYKEDGVLTRAEQAKEMGAEAYVAIHSNAFGNANDGKYQGTTVYYGGQNEGSKELAQFIFNRVGALTPTKDNGIHDDIYESKINKQTPYAEIWRPAMANLILEVEYHDYHTYAKWITEHTRELGEAIAYGIDDWLKSISE